MKRSVLHLVKKVLLIIKSPPYGSGRAAEGLRVATAMIAMDMLPRILFMDDGVYCLIQNQKPEAAGFTSLDERLKTLADLIGLHAFSDSLAQRKLGQDDLNRNYNVKIKSRDDTARLISQSETVMTF